MNNLLNHSYWNSVNISLPIYCQFPHYRSVNHYNFYITVQLNLALTGISNTDIPLAMAYGSKILLSKSGIPILSEVPRFVGGKMQAKQLFS